MPFDINESPDFFAIDDKITSSNREVIVLNSENDPNRTLSLEPKTTVNSIFSNGNYYPLYNPGSFNSFALSGTYYVTGSSIVNRVIDSE